MAPQVRKAKAAPWTERKNTIEGQRLAKQYDRNGESWYLPGNNRYFPAGSANGGRIILRFRRAALRVAEVQRETVHPHSGYPVPPVSTPVH